MFSVVANHCHVECGARCLLTSGTIVSSRAWFLPQIHCDLSSHEMHVVQYMFVHNPIAYFRNISSASHGEDCPICKCLLVCGHLGPPVPFGKVTVFRLHGKLRTMLWKSRRNGTYGTFSIVPGGGPSSRNASVYLIVGRCLGRKANEMHSRLSR